MPQAPLEHLLTYIKRNTLLMTVLERLPRLDLPGWYLGAGSIAQTVWNVRHGFEPTAHIRDYDVIYHDASDLSYEGEDRVIKRAVECFDELPAPVEVRNQARVHLWYEDHFGYPIEPIRSSEDAIDRWPIIATCMGLTMDRVGEIGLYAPYGLADTLGMIVRPNKRQITRTIYLGKANRWKDTWPEITVIPWNDE